MPSCGNLISKAYKDLQTVMLCCKTQLNTPLTNNNYQMLQYYQHYLWVPILSYARYGADQQYTILQQFVMANFLFKAYN